MPAPVGLTASGGTVPHQLSPVIVLAYAHAGAPRLWQLLADSPVLACTSGTGVLPLCDQAAATWRKVDSRDDTLSPLAAATIRALVGSVITAILADIGGSRWCEISFAAHRGAETFLRLYPAAKFVCLHRSCPHVIRSAIEANPWGLDGTMFGQFATAHPASSAATIAAYWASCTESLLRFEDAHPSATRRVRYEDLDRTPDQEANDIFAFLNLAPHNPAFAAPTGMDMTPATEEARASGPAAEMPAEVIPPSLRTHVNDLQASIGYPPVT